MRNREGFTLVETLVVGMLGLVILVAVAQVLSTQGRGFRHQTTVVMAHSNARVAVQVLASELREVSATGGDLISAGENSITVRSLEKVGLICDDASAATGVVDVWRLGGRAFQGAGTGSDSVLVFLNADPELATDDSWAALSVASASNTVSASCTDWPEYTLSGAEGDNYPTQRLTLDGPSIADASVGGLVRSFRHVTYAIAEDDGGWALTRQTGDENASVVLVKDLASPDESGLVFSYFDTNGTPITAATAAANPGSVGRLELTVTASMASPIIAGGDGSYQNALSTSVYFRNNWIDQTFGLGGGNGT